MPNQIDYEYQFVYLQKSLIHSFLQNYIVLLLLTSPNNKIESEMAYNTLAFLDQLAGTDYGDFDKCQDRFGQISWSKSSFDYLDVKHKVFKKEENKEYRLAQNFSKEESLTPVQVKLLAKDMEEQLKLTHKVVLVVDRPHREICVTMLRYNVEKPETSYVQLRLFGRRKDEEKFNQIWTTNLMSVFIYLM